MVNKMMCVFGGYLPDGRLVEVRRFSDGATVVIQARQTGINTGPIGWAGGAPATGRPVDVDQARTRSTFTMGALAPSTSTWIASP